MPRLLSALAIAAFMVMVGAPAQAVPAPALLNSPSAGQTTVEKAHWRHHHHRCWWRHGHRHCRWW
jgi:hypothetical protein